MTSHQAICLSVSPTTPGFLAGTWPSMTNLSSYSKWDQFDDDDDDDDQLCTHNQLRTHIQQAAREVSRTLNTDEGKQDMLKALRGEASVEFMGAFEVSGDTPAGKAMMRFCEAAMGSMEMSGEAGASASSSSDSGSPSSAGADIAGGYGVGDPIFYTGQTLDLREDMHMTQDSCVANERFTLQYGEEGEVVGPVRCAARSKPRLSNTTTY